MQGTDASAIGGNKAGLDDDLAFGHDDLEFG
jgi:hypothetical protein